jgi:hypothetical protein
MRSIGIQSGPEQGKQLERASGSVQGNGHLVAGNGHVIGNGYVTGDAVLAAQPTTMLVKELFEDGQRIMRAEVELAKVELREDVKRAKSGAIALGISSAVLFTSLIVVAFACVYLLSMVVASWVAALIVGGVLLVAGVVCGMIGAKKLSHSKPNATIETIKEDGRWIKQTLSEMRSMRHEHT